VEQDRVAAEAVVEDPMEAGMKAGMEAPVEAEGTILTHRL
jgi:hypothetical protein